MARRPRLDLDGIRHIVNRDAAIIEALEDGYTQGEVTRYLDVSAALVSYIFKGKE